MHSSVNSPEVILALEIFIRRQLSSIPTRYLQLISLLFKLPQSLLESVFRVKIPQRQNDDLFSKEQDEHNQSFDDSAQSETIWKSEIRARVPSV